MRMGFLLDAVDFNLAKAQSCYLLRLFAVRII